MRRRSAALVILALLALAACELFENVDLTGEQPDVVAPVPSFAPSTARTQLADLTLIDRHPEGLAAYVRDAFGTAWKDVDGNGCNQRDDVLLRDAVPGTTTVQVQRSCPHDVVAGTWVDPYTGKHLSFDDLKDPRQSQAIQIDHVVPLAEAWVSGAHAWPRARREQFANDLTVLLASDGPTNASKGSSDPAAWKPRKAFQCTYATHWIDVKHRWRLAVDASEAKALTEMLQRCPED